MSPADPKAPRRRWRDRRGVAASEFALMAPIFFLVALATADLIRVFRAQLRTETVAVQLGQIISQCRIITDGATIANAANPDNSDIAQFWRIAARIGGNLVDINSATGGSVILSAVGRVTTAGVSSNRVEWRRRTGNTLHTSSISVGTPPVAATITNGFIVPSGQVLFVTEVYAAVQSWTLSAGLIGTLLPKVVGGTTLFLSRAPNASALLTAPRVGVTPECTA